MAKLKSVLITGGFGYVGSRLTPHLLELGYSVTILDLCLYGDYGLYALESHPRFSEFKNRFRLIRQDIRHAEAVRQAMEGCDAVIHLAAVSDDPTGQIDETITRQVNFDAVGLLLAKAKAAGIQRFINASSSSVYGIKREAQVTENLEPEPLTLYSKYKMLSEWLVVAAASETFVTVNVRPATICGYSPRQRFDLTVNKLTADALRKKVITVHGGEQRRPNVGMHDMIYLYSHLLQLESTAINGRTFNFGFENMKVIDIAKLVQSQIMEFDVKIDVTETQDNRDYHISSDKLLRELKFKPMSSIAKEVLELKQALLAGVYPNTEEGRFYNMKSMKLIRDASAYHFLSR